MMYVRLVEVTSDELFDSDAAVIEAEVAAVEAGFAAKPAAGEWLDRATVRPLSDELLVALRGIVSYAAGNNAADPGHPFHRAWSSRMAQARAAIKRAEVRR